MINRELLPLNVNGSPSEVRVADGDTLLTVLRDQLGLTGTKNGCGTGHCGACTILLDGRATKSCIYPVKKAVDAEIITIEGLNGPDGGLHPVQAAFLAAGAVQCGFCSPGLILATVAFLSRKPDPDDDDIKRSLRGNICRCTGYRKVIDAVHLAARWVKYPEDAWKKAKHYGVGRNQIDVDGAAKVTGALVFADDLKEAGTLFGKIRWSDHPHARIVLIDTDAAGRMDGVVRILTHTDVPGLNAMGSLKADQPVLCSDKVRYMGDALALVLAESMAAADEAAGKIEVEYEALPGVYSVHDALGPDATLLYDGGNVCKHLAHQVGDPDSAMAKAEIVASGRFKTPAVEHAYLEPEAALGIPAGKDRISVYAPTQFPFEIRTQLSRVLDLPEENIRVIATPLGGAFGSKLDNTVEALAAVGAFVAQRPVKITLSRKESLIMSTKRHPYELDYRVGFHKDGRIAAVDAKLLSDAGPYTALSPRVIDQACLFSCGPYRVHHMKVEGWAVHTNNANSSAFRGFGINQAALAIESMMDEAAVELGIDPFEIRLINALKIGDATISGEILKVSVGAEATIRAARDAMKKEYGWIESARKEGRRIGFGVAAGYKNVGAGKGKLDDAGAIFRLQPDGRIALYASAVDMGQGIRTALLQIAAERLGMDEDNFDLVTGDTDRTIRHGGAVGERQLFVCGRAVEIAAGMFIEKILERAANILGKSESPPEWEKGYILSGDDSGPMSLAELAGKISSEGDVLEVSYYHTTPKTYALADAEARRTVPSEEYRNYPAYAYTAQAAIVEVPADGGGVKVLKIIAAHDCGKAINPQIIEGQIEGSCAQGLGYALTEEYKVNEGQPVTTRFDQLGLPRIDDMPEVEIHLIEDPDPNGPLGAKGISEVATVPITPAILNAIRDATGIRVYHLPVRPDRIAGTVE